MLHTIFGLVDVSLVADGSERPKKCGASILLVREDRVMAPSPVFQTLMRYPSLRFSAWRSAAERGFEGLDSTSYSRRQASSKRTATRHRVAQPSFAHAFHASS